jgi:hypothetical protein
VSERATPPSPYHLHAGKCAAPPRLHAEPAALTSLLPSPSPSHLSSVFPCRSPPSRACPSVVHASSSTPSMPRRLPHPTLPVSVVSLHLCLSQVRSWPPSATVKSSPSSVCPSATVRMSLVLRRRAHCAQARHASWAAAAAVGRGQRRASGPRQHCAAGPRADSAQWLLIYIFLFSEYIQIPVNSKNCVGFI